jgi:hypothetical protein
MLIGGLLQSSCHIRTRKHLRKEIMMTLFLMICVGSVIFFLFFLTQCSRPERKPSPSVLKTSQPVIHKILASEAEVSIVDRHLFVKLEQQMAEFVSSRGRHAATL